MVSRPLARARAMRSRTCADVIQPCPLRLTPGGGKMRDPGNEVGFTGEEKVSIVIH